MGFLPLGKMLATMLNALGEEERGGGQLVSRVNALWENIDGNGFWFLERLVEGLETWRGKDVDHPRDLVPELWEEGSRIYVENIRAARDTTTVKAKEYCEECVSQGLLERVVTMTCPNSDCRRVLWGSKPESPMPEYMRCEVCEIEEKDVYKWRTTDLPRETCYRVPAKEKD